MGEVRVDYFWSRQNTHLTSCSLPLTRALTVVFSLTQVVHVLLPHLGHGFMWTEQTGRLQPRHTCSSALQTALLQTGHESTCKLQRVLLHLEHLEVCVVQSVLPHSVQMFRHLRQARVPHIAHVKAASSLHSRLVQEGQAHESDSQRTFAHRLHATVSCSQISSVHVEQTDALVLLRLTPQSLHKPMLAAPLVPFHAIGNDLLGPTSRLP